LKMNEIDLDKTEIALGPVLKMDPKTEKFKGNSKANAMLTRNYRKPYVITDMV
jgi:hypothetical protein